MVWGSPGRETKRVKPGLLAEKSRVSSDISWLWQGGMPSGKHVFYLLFLYVPLSVSLN
jgi:hypothetical protein